MFTIPGFFIILCTLAYLLGWWDRSNKPPPPMKGTYDSGEHDDRVEEYDDDWI